MPALTSVDPARVVDEVGGRENAIRAVGLHLRTAERLRELIITGLIPAGSVLPEIDLSASLGVSRTPLREALKLLVADGLVVLRQNRSARVPDWEPAEILEIFEALAGFERLGAELAAVRMTEGQMAELLVLQTRMNELYASGDLTAYVGVNLDLHAFVMVAGRNHPLVEAHKSVQTRARWARLRVLAARGRWVRSDHEHLGIIAALQARDPGEAGRLAQDHVLQEGRTIVRALQEVLAEDLERSWRPDENRVPDSQVARPAPPRSM